MNRKQNIFVFAICTALWLCGALIIFAGMIADSINNAGYSIQACHVSTTMIVEFSSKKISSEKSSEKSSSTSSFACASNLAKSTKFRGLVNIQYTLITSDWIEVYIGNTWNITRAYLNTNYPVGKMLGCYASATNVRLTLYNHDSIVLAGASIIALSILASLIYFVVLVIECTRRKGYRDLDERSHRDNVEIEIKRVDRNQGSNEPPQL